MNIKKLKKLIKVYKEEKFWYQNLISKSNVHLASVTRKVIEKQNKLTRKMVHGMIKQFSLDTATGVDLDERCKEIDPSLSRSEKKEKQKT